MPVDAFDNHLKIPFVEERLCRLPKNTDEIFPTSFCADAPPHLQVPHRPGLRAFHSMLTENTKATGKLLVLALGSFQAPMAKRKHMALALPCAPHRDTGTCVPVAFYMRAAFPGRQSLLPGARLTGRRFPKRKLLPAFLQDSYGMSWTDFSRTAEKRTP